MTAAAFQATYSDWRLVRSRKVCQVVLEIPLEEATYVLDCLGGMPNPASEIWVACARLNKESEVVPDRHVSVASHDKTPPASAPEQPARAPRLTDGAAREAPREPEDAQQAANALAPAIPARAPRPFTSLPLPQQAALLCQEPVFIAFLDENFDFGETVRDPADLVRHICGVVSRRHLNPDSEAGQLFIQLRERFFAWKQVAA